MFTITDDEKQFLRYIEVYRDIGYGRMMQMIANKWYRQLQRDHPGMEVGAFAGHTCFGLLPEQEQQAFLQVLEMEEKQGMEYQETDHTAQVIVADMPEVYTVEWIDRQGNHHRLATPDKSIAQAKYDQLYLKYINGAIKELQVSADL